MGEFGQLLIPLICLGLIFGIPYYVFRQITKKVKKEVCVYKSKIEKEKRETEDKVVVDEHIQVVKKVLNYTMS